MKRFLLAGIASILFFLVAPGSFAQEDEIEKAASSVPPEAAAKPLSPFVCGDGKCEESEKTRCAQDCGGPPGSGRCGDGTCDFYEGRDKNCPLDCNLSDTAGSEDYNADSKSRYVPGSEVEALRRQLDALKAAPSAPDAQKTPSGPSVCGDGQCDEKEKDSCSLDCGASTGRCGDGTCDSYEARDRKCPVDCELTHTQSAEGTNAQPASETRFVPRSEFENLQKQVEELKANPSAPPSEEPKKPAGPSVCGDGQCDDKEKGRCDRDCGSGPSDPFGDKIRCGDGDCDAGERRDKTCPVDCDLTNY